MASRRDVSWSCVFLLTAFLDAQETPRNYANVAVEDCGKVGVLLHESSGTGTRAGRTTRYATASFEIDCNDQHVGQLDIQTADNEPALITYRQNKGQPESETVSGTDVDSLVRASIRSVCSCSAN